MRLLTISYGDYDDGNKVALAKIAEVQHLTWNVFARSLAIEPHDTDNKAVNGWYSCATYDPVYRDGANLVSRDCLTFDYDDITVPDVGRIIAAYKAYAHVMYTTFSHTAEKPRLRLVFPLSRPTTKVEFEAVSRKVADFAGIELTSRETHVAAQMMYLPTKKPDAPFKSRIVEGAWIDVDTILADYKDWTDQSQWPRKDGLDHIATDGKAENPLEKSGVVGDFCRAFTISEAIARFDLPYTRRSDNPSRWDYLNGSVADGARTYDNDTKIHNENGTNPAHGQHNAFDLVRLHRFGSLDAECPDAPIGERPSFRAMCDLVSDQSEIVAVRAVEEFEDLGPLPEGPTLATGAAGAQALARRIVDVLRCPTEPRWLLVDRLEHGVIALIAGPRGSYKSFLALDWAFRCALAGYAVYVVSAEGGDFDRRAKAWLDRFGDGREVSGLQLFVVERRLDLSKKEGVETIRQDCLALKIKPALFVLDTYSKLTGGIDENDNSEVKQFVGRLDNGLKRADTGFDATVLLICHTGHSDAGRPRGASALAADTDAEYIVSREGAIASVTRDRFKSSPELPPLTYVTRVVDIGRKDAQGAAITSLILEEAHVKASAKLKEPTSVNHKIVWRAVKKMSLAGESVAEDDVLEAAVDQTAGSKTERKTTKQSMRRALTALYTSGHLTKHGEDRVSASNAVVPSAEEFDVVPENKAQD